MRKTVIMKKPQATGIRFLLPGERVSIRSSTAERWVETGTAEWAPAESETMPPAAGKKATGAARRSAADKGVKTEGG